MNCRRNRPIERRPGRLLCKAHKHFRRSDNHEELRAYYVRGVVDSLDPESPSWDYPMRSEIPGPDDDDYA